MCFRFFPIISDDHSERQRPSYASYLFYFFLTPQSPFLFLYFLNVSRFFFLLPPLYFFFFPHFILYANRHLHNPRFPIIFVYIAVVFFADSESRPKKERFCNAPAAAPPPPRWPPPRTSRPDVTTRRHDRQH
jgi:hypothetical protein